MRRRTTVLAVLIGSMLVTACAGDEAMGSLCYGAPSARGREIMGGLLVYGQPEPIGANEPTTTHLHAPATVGGVELEPGSYSIYAIADEDEWEFFIDTMVGALTYRMAPVEIADLVGAVVATCQRRAGERDVKLSVTSLATAQISGDHDRLHQLLNNLLENALRYTDSGGCIEVAGFAQPDGSYQLTVDDSPPAIPEAKLPRLFEPLYRTEEARSRKTGGAGLGLAICHNIVAAHSGRISAAASPLGGLRITVNLP